MVSLSQLEQAASLVSRDVFGIHTFDLSGLSGPSGPADCDDSITQHARNGGEVLSPVHSTTC